MLEFFISIFTSCRHKTLSLSIKKMKQVLLILAILLFNFSCTSSADSGNYQSAEQSYKETKLSLEDQERQNPLNFLKSDGTYRENLVGKLVLEGNVTNSASVITYKDVTLQIAFYSATQTLLGTEEQTIYEYFPPGQSVSFKFKTFGFRETKSVGWKVVKATPAN